MKLSFSLFIILFFFSTLYAQENKIKELENKLSKVKGVNRIELLSTLSDEYLNSNPPKTKKAIKYAEEALKLAKKNRIGDKTTASINGTLSVAYTIENDNINALRYSAAEVEILEKISSQNDLVRAYYNLGNLRRKVSVKNIKLKNIKSVQKVFKKSAIDYFSKSLALAKEQNLNMAIMQNNLALYEEYSKQGKKELALQYYQDYILIRDMSMNIKMKEDEIMNKSVALNEQTQKRKIEKTLSEAQIKTLNEQKQQVEQQKQEVEEQNKIARQKIEYQRNLISLFIVIIAIILIFSVVVVILLRKNAAANKILKKQKAEIENQAKQLSLTNSELEQKNVQIINQQDQLIRQEKLASVGKLTKGLFDRILNPLNYINNFSKFTIELIPEIQELTETIKDDKIKTEISKISEEISEKLYKIYEHGNSATRIIKSMENIIQPKPSMFEKVDLNKLLAEKTEFTIKEFKNIEIKPIFKLTEIPQINLIRLDFAQAINNIINNSCYAINEKIKLSKNNYYPELIIESQVLNNQITINIKDNGIGIQKINIDKIFDPFFTTKPTSIASGLGLYIAQDTVKQHKGTIEVKSEQNEFTEIIIKIVKS